MEYLTKHQLILVALLVSFVTSIATGIVTVALMQQAPQTVTQTVNRVVQETVQEVVPTAAGNTSATASKSSSDSQSVSSDGQSGSTVVVPTTNDVLVGLVEKSSPSLVRIKGTATQNPPVFLGIGTLVSKEGIIVADGQIASAGMTYVGVADNGSSTPIDLIAMNQSSGLAYFQIAGMATSSGQQSLSALANGGFSPATLGDSNTLKVGQSVFVLGGQDQDTIAKGVVTSLVRGSGSQQYGSSGAAAGPLTQINSDTAFDQPVAPLIDFSGKVIGFETANDGAAPSEFLPVNVMKAQLQELLQAEASSTAQALQTASTTARS